jgi:hypothetical protein
MKSKTSYYFVLVGIIIAILNSGFRIVQYFFFKNLNNELFNQVFGNIQFIMNLNLILAIFTLFASLFLATYLSRFSRGPSKSNLIMHLVLGALIIFTGSGLGGLLILIGSIIGLVQYNK